MQIQMVHVNSCYNLTILSPDLDILSRGQLEISAFYIEFLIYDLVSPEMKNVEKTTIRMVS